MVQRKLCVYPILYHWNCDFKIISAPGYRRRIQSKRRIKQVRHTSS